MSGDSPPMIVNAPSIGSFLSHTVPTGTLPYITWPSLVMHFVAIVGVAFEGVFSKDN